MKSSPTLHANPAIPFLVAAVGICFFSMMDVAMKSLSISMGAFSAVFWRNIIGTVMAGAPYLAMRQPWPKPDVMRLHMKRSIVVAIMAVMFFWALARLPIAEAIGLSFFAPVIALYLAAILLGEKIGKEAIIASVTGIAGVAIIVSAKFSGDYEEEALWGTVAVMISACLFAYNLILAREQAQQAEPLEIAFFQNLLTAATLAIAAPWFLDGLQADKIPLLSGAAALAIISVLLLSWAYARAEAQILIPVEYTAFAWAAIFGWYFFAEAVTWPTIVGTALIVAGSVVAARAKPNPPAAAEIG